MLIANRNAMLVKDGYTAGDYVQNGLIAMWDGIENAGWGVHNSNASVWKDLSGNGYDLTGNEDNEVTVAENCYYFPGGGVSKCLYHIRAGEFLGTKVCSAHLCLACDGRLSGYGNEEAGPINIAANTYWDVSVGSLKVYGRNRITLSNSVPGGWVDRWNIDYPNFFSDNITHSLSITTPEQYAQPTVIVDGHQYVTQKLNNLMASSIYINGNYTDAILGYYVKCQIYNISLYSRALTTDEIAANYAVDKIRFNLQ